MNGLSTKIVDALPLATFVLDENNHITFLNPAAEEWIGRSARHVISQGITEYVVFPESLTALQCKAREHAQSFSEYGVSLTLTDGSPHLVNVHVVPMEGSVMLAFARMRYAPAQAQLAASEERARTSGLMAAMLAHEVKNPLSGIRGAAQLLLEELSPEHRQLAELICNEVDRIRDVLAEVEPFSENTLNTGDQVNVHEVLRYARGVAQAGFPRKVEFREAFDPSVPEISSSRGALIKIVLNLINNAAEAGAKTITLTTTTRQDYEVVGRAGHISPQLHVMIQDDGPGVPEGLRSTLFEPFISGKAEKGRGLGLAIAAKLAGDMGGVLVLESTQAGCTRFRLTLRAV